MPGYGPNPEKKLHANRKHSTFWADGQGSLVTSRHHQIWNEVDQEFNTQLKHAFGHEMSAERADAYDRHKKNHLSSRWLRAHTIHRVPKVFVFSPMLNWTEAWEKCVFQYMWQVVGTSLCDVGSKFGVYYGIDQWNTSGKLAAGLMNLPELKQHGQQAICQLTNVWYETHRKMYDAFDAARKILASNEKDPIYSVLLPWCPKEQYQVEMPHDYTQPQETGRPYYEQADPMYNYPELVTQFCHPDPDNEKNIGPSFVGPPALLCPRPGFGTNVLHCYAGHWGTSYGGGSMNIEAWPASPAGLQFGGAYSGLYLGAPQRGLNGRRLQWRDCGYAYGYSESDLLDYYEGSYMGAAEQYKDNFYKYRDFGLRLFNYSRKQNFNWSPEAIWADRLEYTEGVFFLGFDEPCDAPGDFCDPIMEGCYSEQYFCGGGDDSSFEITGGIDGGDLKYGKHTFSILRRFFYEDAIRNWYPDIRDRIEKYYNGIPGGTATFMKGVLSRTGLGAYNAEYAGGCEGKMDNAGAMVEYVLNYFSQHRS